MRTLRAAVVLAVSLSYLSYVFDVFHDRFWTAGLGDWIDPYFINYLLEHWFHAVTTFSAPFSPPMFFPAEKTIGYSHALLLYAPFYVPVRAFFHPFQAYSLSLLVIIETGIVCLYVIFRRFMQLSFLESLLLTLFFFTSANVINGTIGVWSQRASVFLIPPIVLLALIAYHQQPGWRQLVTAFISGFLATLLFPHDFYSGFFAFFFGALFLAAWMLVEGHMSASVPRFGLAGQRISENVALGAFLVTAAWTIYLWTSGGVRTRILGIRIASQDWRRPALLALLCVAVYTWLRGVPRIRADLEAAIGKSRTLTRPWVWAIALGGILGCGVFLWAYLPAYREHPRFPEHDLLSQIRVRAWRRWSSPFQDLSAYDTVRTFKLVTIVGLLACIPWIGLGRKIRWYVVWLFVVSALVLVMPLRIDSFAIWLSFFRYIPGFSVIRDPTRVIFEYEFAFILAAGLLLTQLRQRPVYRTCVCLLFAYFLITDHRCDKLAYERPRDVFRRWVEAPIDIDPACRSFYIKRASPEYMSRSENMWALYAGDSMFIALQHGIPTLNGYSAWGPEEWDLMNPPEPTYPNAVRVWIHKNNLRDVCELDIDARTMRLASTN